LPERRKDLQELTGFLHRQSRQVCATFGPERSNLNEKTMTRNAFAVLMFMTSSNRGRLFDR